MSSERDSCAGSRSGCGLNEARKVRIRQMNDDLRRTMVGGQVLITRGIEGPGLMTVSSILHAVRQFDEFSPSNDPFDEHDFGALTCLDQRVYWKIDYYDRELEFGSPNPADPHVTTRVITIMLASEY